jgi:hypothetical protein
MKSSIIQAVTLSLCAILFVVLSATMTTVDARLVGGMAGSIGGVRNLSKSLVEGKNARRHLSDSEGMSPNVVCTICLCVGACVH